MLTFIAVVLALASLVAAIGYDGYLFMLGSAAGRRAGGEPVAQYVRSRWPVAGATTVGSLLALLMASAGDFPAVLAILLSVGAGAAAARGLQAAQRQLRSGGQG
ncbi:hypothetical protein GCM10010174_09100 [Kutzneria viridogrisea]|uniref:Membrane protein n=1 Tax=Kutzneria viridogrisea TaxID=47990 RepID=A0ABR6BX21_9PSEU|nr:putative membrane protein [Kutzneria viridogrisea]